jgi:hypothetical protein
MYAKRYNSHMENVTLNRVVKQHFQLYSRTLSWSYKPSKCRHKHFRISHPQRLKQHIYVYIYRNIHVISIFYLRPGISLLYYLLVYNEHIKNSLN